VDHLQARDLLNGYLDGDLPASSSAQVAQHLEACPECRAELADLRRLKAWLQAVPEVEPPRSFVLTRGQAETPRWLRMVRYATAVAAILLVALLTGDVMSQGLPPSNPAPKTVTSSQRVTATQTSEAAAPFSEPQVAPTVAGAKATDPNAPFLEAGSSSPEERRPPPGIRVAEAAVLIVLTGLAAAWLLGWLTRRPRFPAPRR
jgi:anti-sigma factor RsiW